MRWNIRTIYHYFFYVYKVSFPSHISTFLFCIKRWIFPISALTSDCPNLHGPRISRGRYARNLSYRLPTTRFYTPENPERFAENADVEILNLDHLFLQPSGVHMLMTGCIYNCLLFCIKIGNTFHFPSHGKRSRKTNEMCV